MIFNIKSSGRDKIEISGDGFLIFSRGGLSPFTAAEDFAVDDIFRVTCEEMN